MKKAFTILLALATSVALLALPAAAGAEYFIPDGNSAVNQYTEGVPSGGGEKSTKGAGEKLVKPGKTLGVENTKKLEQAGGEEGREAAEVAAETAPPEIAVVEEEQSDDQQSGKSKGQGDKGKAQPDPEENDPSVNTKDNVLVTPASSGDGPSGSGGLGEVVSAATGGSDGGIGLLLPLVIVAALAWGIAFAWRKRDSDPTAPAPR
jgi:hypothetical protein